MNIAPEFDSLQFEFIKDTIPFVADDIAEAEDHADFEIDFSIVDIDAYAESKTESETESVAQNFLDQSETRLSNINRHLKAWRANGVAEYILTGICSEFQSLESSAASAEFEDVSRLSQAVISLLGQGESISDDSSLLNLLEEMHDGLVAELGFSGKASENHLRSLISMVQLLIADKFTSASAATSDASDEQYIDVPIEHPQMTEYQQDAGAGELVEQVPAPVPALLVTAGRYRVALLIHTIERVMRVHENENENENENEIQLPAGQPLDGQPCVVLAEKPIPIINLSTCLGEAHIRGEDSARFLVIIRPQDRLAADDIVANKMLAIEVDRFQEVADIVVQPADSPLPANTGVVGVAMLTDASLVLVLDVEQFIAQEGFQVWRQFYDHERQSADSNVETNKSVESYRD